MSRLAPFGTLFRYFAKRYFGWVALCLVGLTAVVSIIQTIELIRRVSIQKNVTAEINYILLTLLNVPTVMDVVLPFALLSGTMLCFNALNKSNEFVVTRGIGTSIWVALSPIIATAFAIGLLFVMVVNPIGSLTTKQYENHMAQIFGSDQGKLSVTADGIWLRDTQTDRQLIIHGDALDTANAGIVNPIIYEFLGSDGLKTRIRGTIMHLTDTGWIVENATAWTNDGTRKEIGNLMIASDVMSLDLERSTDPPETISVYLLPGFIDVLEHTGLPTVDHRIHFHQILALPLLMVGIAMLGARFTIANVNRGRRMQLFTRGVLIATIVFVVGYFMQVLGASLRVPANVAGWSPAVVLLLTGAAFLARIDES